MNWNRIRFIGKGFVFGIGALVFASLMALLLGFVLLFLWNWLMPAIFGLPVITYWQAWGLILLSHLLFKGHGGHGRHGHPGFRGHNRNCDDKDFQDFRKKFRERMRHHEAHGLEERQE